VRVPSTYNLASARDQVLHARVERLLKSRRDWIERASVSPASDYDAIRLYTSKSGYDRIFSVVNRVFRSDHSDDLDGAITNAVFLVELLNIDLHNYCKRVPAAHDFQGTVHRGICVTEAQLERFASLMNGPITERYISIPLGLVSASRTPAVPRTFVGGMLARNPSLRPLMWKVHVVGIRDELMELYRQSFSSIVSTICAVPVAELSDFRAEEEVLLRGPFFQVIDFTRDDPGEGLIQGMPVSVLEVMMVTGNRDHYTTMQLGSKDSPARELFGAMARLERYEFCAGDSRRRGRADVREYEQALASARQQLVALQTRLS
jgi:hypothetical protein